MAYASPLDPLTPAFDAQVSQGDDRIRETKAALIERLESVFLDVDVDPMVLIDVSTGTLTPTAATKDLGSVALPYRDAWLSRSLNIVEGALTADINAILTTATWNAGAVEFTHWLASITDTASAATSKLLEFLVGGVSRFALTKAGALTVTGLVTAAGFAGPLTGAVTGNVTGNVTGSAATVTAAAQPAITSVGTLTSLQVDNLNFNGNTISSTAGVDLHITPLAGQQLVLDGTIVIDAGVVTGATSITSATFVGNLTGNVTGSSGSTTGNAATATALATPRAINGVNFDGTAAITVTAAAGTLTGNTLAAGVTASSLTSLGIIATLQASNIVIPIGGRIQAGNGDLNANLTLAMSHSVGGSPQLADALRLSGTLSIGSTYVEIREHTDVFKRISYGAADSGGTGFKVLRVAN